MKKIFLYSISAFLLMVFSICFSNNTSVSMAAKLTIVMPKKVNVYLSDVKDIKPKVYLDGVNVTEDADLKWRKSNKNISIDWIDNAECSIYTNKVGKCKLTLTAEYCPADWDDDYFDDDYELDYNTYTAKAECLITVKYFNSLRAYGGLDSYNTRTNTFTVKLRNISKKTITILSKNAAVYEDDYTAYDRRVKLAGGKSSIKIKPGQKKTIKFKVIGNLTWYNVSDFQLCSYWKWGKKKYWVSVNTAQEVWKRSKKKWVWAGFAI